MQDWKERPRYKSIDEEAIGIGEGRLVLAKSGHIRLGEMEFKAKVDALLESYLPVLREHGLPESVVRTILS